MGESRRHVRIVPKGRDVSYSVTFIGRDGVGYTLFDEDPINLQIRLVREKRRHAALTAAQFADWVNRYQEESCRDENAMRKRLAVCEEALSRIEMIANVARFGEEEDEC